MKERYYGGFAEKGYGEAEPGWQRLQEEFAMKETEPDEVLFASYDLGGYEGSADVVYRNGSDYFYVSARHCSCFGLEGQWEPEKYSADTLKAALERDWMSEDRRRLILERL